MRKRDAENRRVGRVGGRASGPQLLRPIIGTFVFESPPLPLLGVQSSTGQRERETVVEEGLYGGNGEVNCFSFIICRRLFSFGKK